MGPPWLIWLRAIRGRHFAPGFEHPLGVEQVVVVIQLVAAVERECQDVAAGIGHQVAERRLERRLAADYARMIENSLPQLDAPRLPALLELASLPEQIRGYGHVKLASVEKTKARERELLATL